jgi:hypothetical protein
MVLIEKAIVNEAYERATKSISILEEIKSLAQT